MGSYAKLHTEAARWLTDALQNPDGDVVLTSPYLTADVGKMISTAAQGSRFRWQLVTALDAGAVANGYLSVQGLRKLLDSGVRLRHVSRVHSKTFLIGTRGLLGSANLTGAGLGSSAASNHELGVELDPNQVAAAKDIILGWSGYSVNHDDLNRLMKQAEELTRSTHGPLNDLNAHSALAFAEQLLTEARDPQRALWLKLEYGEPALKGWLQDAYFASPKKGRPSFKPGDLVLICAKETHDCYAVVEVTSEPEFQPVSYVTEMNRIDPAAVERWPWINRTTPRLVPNELMPLKLHELGISGQGLQNGHVRLKFDQFTAGVRALSRLAIE